MVGRIALRLHHAAGSNDKITNTLSAYTTFHFTTVVATGST
jgi:hypothetical protein